MTSGTHAGATRKASSKAHSTFKAVHGRQDLVCNTNASSNNYAGATATGAAITDAIAAGPLLPKPCFEASSDQQLSAADTSPHQQHHSYTCTTTHLPPAPPPSVQFLQSVTELVVAQCYYLDFDDRNRQKPIYVYLNSTGCINDQGQAISADNEFYAIWAALGFTRAPLYTGVTWKAQNQAAVLLAAGQKGHRWGTHGCASTCCVRHVAAAASRAGGQCNG